MRLLIFLIACGQFVNAQEPVVNESLLMTNVKIVLNRTELQNDLYLIGPNQENDAVIAILKHRDDGFDKILRIIANKPKWKKDKFISCKTHSDAFRSFQSIQRPSLQVVIYRLGHENYIFKLDLYKNIPR